MRIRIDIQEGDNAATRDMKMQNEEEKMHLMVSFCEMAKISEIFHVSGLLLYFRQFVIFRQRCIIG